MYKVILSVLLAIFLVSCNNDDTTTYIIPVKEDVFYPVKTSNIVLDYNFLGYITANNSKYWVALGDMSTMIFGVINPDGSSEKIKTIQNEDRYSIDSVAIYENYVVAFRRNPNEIVTYKIDDNLSVEELATTSLSTDASYSFSPAYQILSIDKNLMAISQQRYYVNEKVQRNEVALFSLDENGSVSKVQDIKDITSDLDMNFGTSVVLSDKTLAISDTKGHVYIYQEDENSTFQYTDMITLENLNTYSRYIYLALDGDFLVLHIDYASDVYIYRLEDGKVKGSKTVVKDGIYKDYIARPKIYGDTILLNMQNSVSVYKIDANSTQFDTSKFLDINVSAVLSSFSETNFILSKNDGLYIYDTNPIDKVYLQNPNDINLSIYENETFNLFYVDASSMNLPLEYSLSGPDSSYFKMVENKLYTYATDTLDYENPTGEDMNNSYHFDIDIVDTKQNIAKINMNIKVLDSEYFLKQRLLNDEDTKHFARSLALENDDLIVGGVKGVRFFKLSDDGLSENFKITSDIYSFGGSISKSSTNLLVGAYSEDIDFIDQGAVYFYKLDENITKVISQSKIIMPNPEKNKYFGTKVVLDDKLAVVSAVGNYATNGEVFTYDIEDNATLSLKQSLISEHSKASDFFGSSLALSDKYLFIGSPKEQFEGNYAFAGAVYMYKRDDNNTLTLVDTLTPDKADVRQYFGNAMAMDGDYIVIGADEDNTFYVYKVSISGEHADRIAKIQNNDIEHFGLYVGINGKDITISSPEVREQVFHYKIDDNDNVTLKEVITDHEDEPIESYERCLVMGDDMFVIGSENFDINDTASGIISVFVKEK